MAKIKSGSLAGQLSGTVGNVVFSHNKGGAYIRRWAKPTKSLTTFAVQAKQRLEVVSQKWQDLDADAQRAWATWSANNPVTDRLGEKIVLSGHGAFVRINGTLVGAGLTMVTTVPSKDPPVPLTSLSMTADIGAGDFELVFAGAPLPANSRLVVQAAVLAHAGQTYFANKLKQVAVGSAATASPFDLEAAVVARFGDLAVGQKVVVLARVLDDSTGLVSLPLEASAIVTSTP